jgi:hypothetical protein
LRQLLLADDSKCRKFPRVAGLDTLGLLPSTSAMYFGGKMAACWQDLAAWMSLHHGVVTRQWLEHEGFSPSEIRGLLNRGQLLVARKGVYVDAASRPTQEQRLVTLVSGSPCVISHATAGQLWGFRKLTRFQATHVMVPHGHPGRRAGVVFHSSVDLMDSDILLRDDGISLTTPLRTVFDLASLVRPDELESVIEQCLDQRMFVVADLYRVARRLARRGRKGSGSFVDLLDQRPADQRPVNSDYELRLARALEEGGFPPLVRQMPLRLPDGSLVHPDLAEPSRRLLIEVDHSAWHGGRRQNNYDRWRDRQYHLVGWHSERVGEVDIDYHLQDVVADLLQIYRSLPELAAVTAVA